jgi:hypothetical protein
LGIYLQTQRLPYFREEAATEEGKTVNIFLPKDGTVIVCNFPDT